MLFLLEWIGEEIHTYLYANIKEPYIEKIELNSSI